MTHWLVTEKALVRERNKCRKYFLQIWRIFLCGAEYISFKQCIYLLLSHYITMSTKRIYRKASLAPIFWVFELCGKFAVSLKMPASVLTGVELGDQGDSQVCGRRISVMPP